MLLSPRLRSTELSTQWMARALGVLYASGGTLAVAWVLLPHPRTSGDAMVVAMAAFAVVLGLLLVLGPTRALPLWTLHTVLAAIQVVISVAYVAEGTPGNDIRLFYAWATPFAAFFFGRRAALAHSVWTGVCLAVCLVRLDAPPGESLRVWLMTMGAVAAVGTLVSIVAGRMREGQRLLHAAAVRDPLTGLANRLGFSAALDDALEAQRRTGGAVVVMLLDLDHFKFVNDSYGHHVGDRVLEKMAPRLVAAVRDGDVVARMGGDEFAVVCADSTGSLDVSACVERLQRVWDAPVPSEVGPLPVSGSIGVVRVEGRGATAESLLRDADIALYRAKAVQRGSAVVYEVGLRDAIDRRARLDRGLRVAMDRGELALAYQAVVDLRTQEVVGAEALLRWTSPELGAVPPGDFIPVAEDRGLMGGIGDWVIDEACRRLARWRTDGVVGDCFVLAVNVSGRQIVPGFAATVADALGRYGLPASALHLEITESVLLDDTTRTRDALDDLCAVGAPLLLDDFGTGFSSLSYLSRLPLHGLKIDRSFVDALNRSPQHRTLVSSMLTMADGLGMAVVAEGVETTEVADALRALGCRRAQGYLWARPEPSASFERRMLASVPAAQVS